MPAANAITTYRPDLAGSMEEFDLAMDRRGFIGMKVLPVSEVSSSAGTFGKIPIEELLRTRTTLRAPGAGYSRANGKFETSTYATEEHGAEEIVDDNEAKMYKDYFDAESVAANRAYDAVLRAQEQRISSLIFNSTTWTGSSLTTAAATVWTTHASAVPLTDIHNAVQKVWDGSGVWPNAVIMSRKAFRELRMCAQLINRVESGGGGRSSFEADITAAQVAQAVDLKYCLVAGGAKNTANEGQSASVSPLWSNTFVMVCRIAETNDFREPCIGRTFHWGEDGSSVMGHIESYRDESVRGDVIRVRHQVDELVLYTQLGHLINTVMA